MTNYIKNVCVFSSSSNNLENKYYEIARELGVLMGRAGFNLVYGGGNVGTMWENAKAVKEFGGIVTGIIPEKIHSVLGPNEICDELVVTKCMRSRKEKLDELSDAVIALPGGFGTLEELSEMIVQKQLGYSSKAIVILNPDGFYDNLLKFFEDMVGQGFAASDMMNLFYVANTPQDAIEYLKKYTPQQYDLNEKLNLKQKLTNLKK